MVAFLTGLVILILNIFVSVASDDISFWSAAGIIFALVLMVLGLTKMAVGEEL